MGKSFKEFIYAILHCAHLFFESQAYLVQAMTRAHLAALSCIFSILNAVK